MNKYIRLLLVLSYSLLVKGKPSFKIALSNYYLILMAKKKGGRIVVAMQCKDCGKTNYHTSINKTNTQKLELTKYCKQDKKRTPHVSREKLK